MAVVPDPSNRPPGVLPGATDAGTVDGRGADPQRKVRRPQLEQVLGIGFVVIGAVLLLRNVGLWFSDELVWPVILVSGGAAVVWSRSDENERARWTALAARLPGRPLETLTAGGVSLARLLIGGVFVLSGLGVFLAANDTLQATRQVLLAVVVTVAGLGLMFGPWVARLLADLQLERRERIRSEERAEMAAHLHDSVLQTLALIQRNADRPRELIALARRQERELRSWLYGDAERTPGGSLVATLEAFATEVEALHDIDVEVVTVGDRTMDERMAAVAGAVREAVVNAAKHSGAPTVSVYVEIEHGRVAAFVRDRGKGFVLADVAPDRQGIMLSIRERIERHGGRATISTAPGEGTEVQLEMPYR